MVWDCLIAWVVIVFTMVGWSSGLLRTWTIPISMALATFVSQHIYIDLSTILVETLHLEPTFAIFIGYAFTWIGLVQYCEAVLSELFRPKDVPVLLIFKMGGGILGFTKGAGAFILAAMVAYSHNKVPEPPVVCWENRWILHAARDSYLLPRIHLVASKLDPKLGKFVLSDSAPRFHANFALGNDPFEKMERQEEERGRNFVKGWKQFQKDMNESFGVGNF